MEVRMFKTIEEKIKSFDDFINIVSNFKRDGKKVVQSHGVFDIIHPGIIRHLQSAKRQGDILIVTVIKDKDVTKGTGYPIFNENLRVENVASIGYVDYVSLVDDDISFDCVKMLKPDIFARGQDYKERDQNIMKRLEDEEEALKVAGCKIHHTTGTLASSTHIINQFLDIYPEETREYLKKFKEKYSAGKIIELLKSLNDLKILVIGDTIIDEYYYCEAMSKSLKDNLVVNRYLYDETFAGGVLAVANHITGLCNNVSLITILGEKDNKEDFILNKLRSNIKTKFFYNEIAPTVVKRRYIDQYSNKKLFELCYIDNDKIPEELEKCMLDYLSQEISSFDMVLVSDFGHGFITEKIIKLIEEKAKILVVNVQTNGANMGYNMITKYHNIDFGCIDESEARLATQDKWGNIEDIAIKISNHINSDYLIITRGKSGSIGITSDGEFNTAPALASKVVDRLGAGDAFLSFTAPCFAKNLPVDLISFIGNAVGALAVQIVGNKNPVGPDKLYEFIYTLLR
jgi:rfaE bifunctional protein kinase chain/domain